jgi:hypothetical protein
MDLSPALSSLAQRVALLSPSHGQPERFHEEKDEISRELRRLARDSETYRPSWLA